jgi:hypothetical protein
MAYAPELKYSDVASRTAFMMQANKQIEDAAQKNGIMVDGGGTFMPGMESGSFLLADTQTANEFGTPGLHPSWVVQVRDVAGQTHILYNEDGSPLRIRFNPQAENGNVTAISRDIEKKNANSHWWTH